MPTAVIRLSIALIALAFFCTAAPAQDTFSSLEERMTGQEYMETGLHKLNEEELAALNEWIRERSLTEGEVDRLAEPRPDGRAAGTAAGDRSTIRSRIDGKFTGWSGRTVFQLQNGMVWRQAERDNFRIAEVENPEVEIRPGALGTWRLSVEGYGSNVLVERID